LALDWRNAARIGCGCPIDRITVVFVDATVSPSAEGDWDYVFDAASAELMKLAYRAGANAGRRLVDPTSSGNRRSH